MSRDTAVDYVLRLQAYVGKKMGSDSAQRTWIEYGINFK